MGGLNTSLLIGLQGLQVAQAALSATSNNIANADTDGYTREVPQFTENALSQQGNSISGGGVTLTGLQSVRDELLNLQIQAQTSQQSSADTQYSQLDQLQTYFTSTGADITSAFSAFSTSLTQLSSNPTSSAAQQSALSAGQNLAQAFNTTAGGLTSAQSTANSQVTQTVAQINNLTAQIAQLNGQVAQLTAAGEDGGTAEDQRDELVQNLSQLTGISVFQSDGGETITTASGTPLVVGSQSYSLQTTTGSDGMQHVLDSSGNDITSSISGGQLGGSIEVRDQVIPGFLSQLNTLATDFADGFNTAQTQGYDSNGNAGEDFFTVPTTNAAAGIQVTITDPSLIAVSSDGSIGSSGNVSNLMSALNSNLSSGQTASQMYASLVSAVGTATSDASTQSTAIGQSLLQLTDLQGSVSGVSTDEETTNLIRFQTAYEAAAKVVSTIQSLNDTTINMIS